ATSQPEYIKALSDPANAQTVSLLNTAQNSPNGFDDTSWLTTANQTLIRPILEGFANSMSLVFLIGGIVVAFSIIFAVLLPDNKLKERGQSAAPAAD
ncbi:MAG: MFS transporter, partial [Actinomycetota bacterium]|nr:MFS transporter [Actinomycetota bacterium]